MKWITVLPYGVLQLPQAIIHSDEEAIASSGHIAGPGRVEDAGVDVSGPDKGTFGPTGLGRGKDYLTVRLPWSKKPFRAEKGVASEPSPALEDADRAKETVLRAICKARRWVDQLVAGDSLAVIATEEGRGERQIRMLLPLAFVAPRTVGDILENRSAAPGVIQLAKRVPLAWPERRAG